MPVFLKLVRSSFIASSTSRGIGDGPALKLNTLFIMNLQITQKEKTSHGTSFSFLAVPPNLAMAKRSEV